MKKAKILILCTGNSCRSQMAEGIFREAAEGRFEVHSAGVNPAGRIHPGAIKYMAEIGIDISGQRSKHVDEFLNAGIDVVITVCDHAHESCPVFPGDADRFHWSFADPAHAEGSEGEVQAAFRQTRDEMHRVFKAFSAGFRTALKTCGGQPNEATRGA